MTTSYTVVKSIPSSEGAVKVGTEFTAQFFTGGSGYRVLITSEHELLNEMIIPSVSWEDWKEYIQ